VKRPGAFPIGVADERRLDRRRFLCTAGAAAAVTLGGEWLGRRVERSRAHTLEVALDLSVPLAEGEARALSDPQGGEALAVRLDGGTVVAFDRRCPHLGCPVLWSGERRRFECPCHAAAFDARTGEVLFGPPRRGLAPARLRSAAAVASRGVEP
jgi:Rieske Fe-S protein